MRGTVGNIFSKSAVIPKDAKCLFILHRGFLKKQKLHNPDFMRPLRIAAKKQARQKVNFTIIIASKEKKIFSAIILKDLKT